ncbi:MAG TPA: NAD(P)/FAD-dependent oxidoreductase [Hanamia sp.]|nr:NAD(P)/FAD-dependent oxidoreductase [Hanamia sp.]
MKEIKYKIDENVSSFAVAVIGGGLAGLSLSILLSKAGYKTILFEKEKYPFHKVCGEYISLESWNFIEDLGLHLTQLNLPIIKKLMVSSPDGNFINANLDLGGFGISRYFLDNKLKEIAVENGVIVYEETKVNEVIFNEGKFTVKYNGGEISSLVVAASFGKRSNLDVKWKRSFIKQKNSKLNNYIGVKYHIKNQFADDTIALHNFKNGYCGISKVEEDKYCLCYLTTAQNLKDHHNSIREMEEKVLFENPFLKKIFSESTFLFKQPITISQISFDKKSQIENHVLFLGDAAGMITPLCGNGMSMAFHAANIAFENIHSFLQGNVNREEMEKRYSDQWQQHFAKRLRNGRLIQRLFGKEKLTNIFIKTIKPFPFIISKMIKGTHGKEF